MLNEVILMGRLTRDPEIRMTQSGTTAASFALACERDYAPQGQPAMDLSRDKNAEEMKWSPLEMGAAMQAHGA